MNKNWYKYFKENPLLWVLSSVLFVALFFLPGGGNILLFIFGILIVSTIVNFFLQLFYPLSIDFIDKSVVFYRPPNKIVKIIRMDQNPEMIVGMFKESTGSRYTTNYIYYKYIAFKDKEGTTLIKKLVPESEVSIFDQASTEIRMKAFEDFEDRIQEFGLSKDKFDEISAKLGI